MRTEQRQWETARGWQPAAPSALNGAAQLVLLFGDTALLRGAALLKSICDAYPQAVIAGCSTAGEILGTRVRDASLSLYIHVPFCASTCDFCAFYQTALRYP